MRLIYKKSAQGFTLMEILVATVIFAIVVSSMLSLFNYVLKINRKSEALRQASQGMRDFVEFLVKEVRNGQIDYFPYNSAGSSYGVSSSPCFKSVSTPVTNTPDTYSNTGINNKIEIIDTNNVQECIYYATPDGTQGGSYTDNVFEITKGAVFIKKPNLNAQQINPPNFSVDSLRFIIRPLCDPYAPNCSPNTNQYQDVQPFVTMMIKFSVKLPTGEQIPINYQTTVSSNKYDIPH